MTSERQRRKEEALALAMSHAAMRGETIRVFASDEATAKRQFQTVTDEVARWEASGQFPFQRMDVRTWPGPPDA